MISVYEDNRDFVSAVWQAIAELLEDVVSHPFRLDQRHIFRISGPGLDFVWDGFDAINDQSTKVIAIHINEEWAWLSTEHIGVLSGAENDRDWRNKRNVKFYELQNPEFPDNLIEDASSVMCHHMAMLDCIREEVEIEHRSKKNAAAF